MSELAKIINLYVPDVGADYQVTVSRKELGSMLRTAMLGGAELVLDAARKRQFVLVQHRKQIGVVEFERIRRFIEGDNGTE